MIVLQLPRGLNQNAVKHESHRAPHYYSYLADVVVIVNNQPKNREKCKTNELGYKKLHAIFERSSFHFRIGQLLCRPQF